MERKRGFWKEQAGGTGVAGCNLVSLSHVVSRHAVMGSNPAAKTAGRGAGDRSDCSEGLVVRECGRRPGNLTAQGFVHRDVVALQHLAGRDVEPDRGAGVGGLRLHLDELGVGEVALVLDHKEDAGSAERELLLLSVEGLLGEQAALHRGAVAGTRLLQSDQGVLHFDADLILLALELEFILAERQLRVGLVGLRSAVPQGDVQLDAGAIVREVAAEDLDSLDGILRPYLLRR